MQYYRTKKVGANDSKFEARMATDLRDQLARHEIKGFDEQVKIPLVVNGYLVCTYIMDFVVYHLDGTTEYRECKGYALDTWKLKFKLLSALYADKPNVLITVVYQGKKHWKPRLMKVKEQL